jgi:hypothetical protein
MRRAAFILCLLCVSAAVVMPVALRAAADTDSRAEGSVVPTKTEVAAILPRAAAKKPSPGSATLLKLPQSDPHPVLTEFFGPAAKAEKAAAPTTALPLARLDSATAAASK